MVNLIYLQCQSKNFRFRNLDVESLDGFTLTETLPDKLALLLLTFPIDLPPVIAASVIFSSDLSFKLFVKDRPLYQKNCTRDSVSSLTQVLSLIKEVKKEAMLDRQKSSLEFWVKEAANCLSAYINQQENGPMDDESQIKRVKFLKEQLLLINI